MYANILKKHIVLNKAEKILLLAISGMAILLVFSPHVVFICEKLGIPMSTGQFRQVVDLSSAGYGVVAIIAGVFGITVPLFAAAWMGAFAGVSG